MRYEQAVAAALSHLRASGALDQPSGGQRAARVMVLGAGRGPLVSAALRAAGSARVPAEVLCIEKNRNALVTLRHRARADAEWAAAGVRVVHADMRSWAGPEDGKSADLIVSELLGSLGDNELSPGAPSAEPPAARAPPFPRRAGR